MAGHGDMFKGSDAFEVNVVTRLPPEKIAQIEAAFREIHAATKKAGITRKMVREACERARRETAIAYGIIEPGPGDLSAAEIREARRLSMERIRPLIEKARKERERVRS